MGQPKEKEHIKFTQREMPVIVQFNRGKSERLRPRPAYHPETEIQLFLSGTGRYFIDGTTYRGGKNTVFIIHPNEIHRSMPLAGSSVSKYSLIFGRSVSANSPLAAALLDDLRDTNAVLLADKEAVECHMLLKEISSEYEAKKDHWKAIVSSNICKIIIILKRAQQSERNAAPLDEDNRLVKRTVEYVRKNHTYNIHLQDVADHLRLSPFHLSRSFKKHSGFGFKEYLILVRISHARQLLLDDHRITVSAVAHRVGFREISSFNHHFKKLTGCTPSAYRKMLLK